jgi:hypothetical protein
MQSNARARSRTGLARAPRLPRLAALIALLCLSPSPARAQSASWLLPGVRYFDGPIADPVEPRLGIGLVVTDVLSRQGPERDPFTRPVRAPEVQAAAAIGGTVPLVHLVNRAGGGLVVGAQAGVFARFRIEQPSRDDLGQDWLVAMPVEARWRDLAARVRITHRSAHLGDEFSAASGAERIEFGGESVDGLFAYQLRRGVRIYGGGGWVFHSNTDNTGVLQRDSRLDRFLVQAGADGEFRPWRNDQLTVVAGVDYQSAERTDWEGALAVAGGLRVHAGPRSIQLMARYLDGTSPMGQFFLTAEEYWSVEVVIAF